MASIEILIPCNAHKVHSLAETALGYVYIFKSMQGRIGGWEGVLHCQLYLAVISGWAPLTGAGGLNRYINIIHCVDPVGQCMVSAALQSERWRVCSLAVISDFSHGRAI